MIIILLFKRSVMYSNTFLRLVPSNHAADPSATIISGAYGSGSGVIYGGNKGFYLFDLTIARVSVIICELLTPRTRGGMEMSEIRVKENESLDSALRRFKRSCARSGVLAEVRKREHYEKPSVRRKKKSEAARKRKR